MDERGMEVQGPKVGPVLEGATLILTCDIIGGNIIYDPKNKIPDVVRSKRT